MPKVSVIIPVYNAEKYIERCARSLFEQTLDDIEYIFVDDCSPDNSITVLQNILEDYPARKAQVKIIRHSKNMGVMSARKTGIGNATGDYVIHCDSDDWLDLNFYECLYNAVTGNSADMAYASFMLDNDNADKEIIALKCYSTGLEFLQHELSFLSSNNSVWNKLYKRKIAQMTGLLLPDSVCMGEDMLLNIQYLQHCEKICCCDNVYYHYYQNPKSATHNPSRKDFCAQVEILRYVTTLNFPDDTLRKRLKYELILKALSENNISSKDYKNLLLPWEGLKLLPATASISLKFIYCLSRISYPFAKWLMKFYEPKTVIIRNSLALLQKITGERLYNSLRNWWKKHRNNQEK